MLYKIRQQNKPGKSTNKGFTLVELLVVISIIGLLSSVVFASLNAARVKARHARRISDLKQLELALTLYADDHNGQYPVASGWNGVHVCPVAWFGGQSTANWIPGLVTGGYISILPRDPSDSGSAVDTNCTLPEYIYTSNGFDFKLIDYLLEDCEGAAKMVPSMKDPARDGGSSYALVDGNNCSAIGVWTQGTVGW